MEKGFEDAFKDKFEGAEVAPSEAVWNNIELELSRADGGDMKRRVLFFQLMAAASVAFAMVFSGTTYYFAQQNVAAKDAQIAALNQADEMVNSSSLSLNEKQNEVVSAQNEINLVQKDHAQLTTIKNESGGTAVVIGDEDSTWRRIHNQTEQELIRKRRIPLTSVAAVNNTSLVQGKEMPERVASPSALYEGPVADPVALMMAQLAEREKELQAGEDSDDKKTKEKLWAAVSVSAGGFNTVNPGVSSGGSSASSSIAFQSVAEEQSNSSGFAYSMGISMGTQVASRWVVQGGVNYLTQTYDYTANTIATSDFQNFEASSVNTANKEDTKLLATSPYSVNNNMRYVSIPLQAGYLVVNKKLGVMVNAGVATDFFIRNTVTPSNGDLSSTSQGNGSESPYKPLNFSGLMGTELSYQLGKQYRLALTPGIRYPFSSVYKESTGIDATPLTFDVGIKFRYLFP